MRTKRLIVQNEHGVHARVALKVVETVKRQSAQITICNGCTKVDGCSILELLLLGAAQGSELEVVARGGDEDKAIRDLEELFSGGLGI